MGQELPVASGEGEGSQLQADAYMGGLLENPLAIPVWHGQEHDPRQVDLESADVDYRYVGLDYGPVFRMFQITDDGPAAAEMDSLVPGSVLRRLLLLPLILDSLPRRRQLGPFSNLA